MIIWCFWEQKLKKHQIPIRHLLIYQKHQQHLNLMGTDFPTPITHFSFLPILKKTWKNVYLVYHVFGVKLEKLDNVLYTWNPRLGEYQWSLCTLPLALVYIETCVIDTSFSEDKP